MFRLIKKKQFPNMISCNKKSVSQLELMDKKILPKFNSWEKIFFSKLNSWKNMKFPNLSPCIKSSFPILNSCKKKKMFPNLNLGLNAVSLLNSWPKAFYQAWNDVKKKFPKVEPMPKSSFLSLISYKQAVSQVCTHA